MTSGDAFTVDCDFPDAIKANCPAANGPDFDFGSSAVLVSLGGGKRALRRRPEIRSRARDRS
jgi:polyvinyl alcohol dehydrogenase (cytochrome)